MFRFATDAEWVDSRVHSLPRRWKRRLTLAWEQKRKTDYVGANVELRTTTNSLLRVRIPLDATDRDLCEGAEAQSRQCLEHAALYGTVAARRSAMERVCASQGVEPPPPAVRDGPAMKRMFCPYWWRRKLRCHQGQTVEAAAVRLGYVSKHRDLYVSDERLAARLQQNARNKATLERTSACNELGQVMTLAELAATSTANKAVRRAEIMTRVSGFERAAIALGHDSVLITVTCPSRFHRYRTVNDGATVIDNPSYDPAETPLTAQRYLARIWSHTRSNLDRLGIKVYGLRVAEPQHDGTPHWHFLLFHVPDQFESMVSTFKKHALKDMPDERGAQAHRCDVKPIDRSKGSASGYIAKYVAKNIDGAHVGSDLHGKPATESAMRVEAWATTWRNRQFQQIGGPPVGVWRELRRVRHVPADAPEHLHLAHRAVNKVNDKDGVAGSTVAWELYCQAQGGVFCGRKASIKLARRRPDALTRYGDEPAPRPYGVETVGPARGADALGSPAAVVQSSTWLVESERHTWSIERRPLAAAAPWACPSEPTKLVQPWTRVNNCTASCSTSRSGPRIDPSVFGGPAKSEVQDAHQMILHQDIGIESIVLPVVHGSHQASLR